VGFVELLGDAAPGSNGTAPEANGAHGHDRKEEPESPRLRLLLEQQWAIGNHLKNEKAESLFSWIGGNIATVVRQGVQEFGLPSDVDLPMGVTFSFPMVQRSLSQATLMAMGKGFAITSNLDLGEHLQTGYNSHWTPDIPRITIAAISNDSVATLVSHIYQFQAAEHQKAIMGLIVGTGCNATIPLKLSSLHESKRPQSVSVLPGQEEDDVRIAVNTEWSINGAAQPLRDLGLISRWDKELDEAGESPGFQPLEYMTAGRYLGELARIIFVDYLRTVLQHNPQTFPGKLLQKFGLTTTFISHFYPGSKKGPMLELLQKEFVSTAEPNFLWTEEHADALHRIAKAIELRAAGIIAAATLGLLACAEEIPTMKNVDDEKRELIVGWTGGCIQHFQTYLEDCQRFLDEALALQFDGGSRYDSPVRVLLSPCHDGGIKGAGILVPAALASQAT
jgi:hexokinase